MIRTLCALALTAAGALALALAGMLTSIISPVGRAIALDVAAYRFVRGGDA